MYRDRSEVRLVVEAVMLWNEPNNLSHWNFEIDPGWDIYAKMVNAAADAVRAERPRLRARARRHLADRPEFIRNLEQQCVLGARRRGRGARLSARLESLDRSTNGPTSSRNSGGHRTAAVGLRSRRLHVRRRRGAGVRPAPHGGTADRPAPSGSTGTACTTCRAPGPPPRAIARRKGRHTTATSTWDCCARTAHPSSR